MGFDTLEKYSEMWKKSKDLQIEKKIVNLMSSTSNFEFPITEEALNDLFYCTKELVNKIKVKER